MNSIAVDLLSDETTRPFASDLANLGRLVHEHMLSGSTRTVAPYARVFPAISARFDSYRQAFVLDGTRLENTGVTTLIEFESVVAGIASAIAIKLQPDFCAEIAVDGSQASLELSQSPSAASLIVVTIAADDASACMTGEHVNERPVERIILEPSEVQLFARDYCLSIPIG